MDKLMTLYDWTMSTDAQGGHHIVLTQLSDGKKLPEFYIANPAVAAHRVAAHMNSLTDDHCEQWFDETLDKDARKVKQAQRKAAARKEREEMEAKVALEKELFAKLRAEEKAREKAKRASRN